MRRLEAATLMLAMFVAAGSIAGAGPTGGPGARPDGGMPAGAASGEASAGASAGAHAGAHAGANAEGGAAEEAGESGVDEGLWVEVDQSEQKVFIHEGGRVVRTLVASTGLPSSPTPNGTFRIENRGEWFYSPKYKQGGMYWVSFLNRGEYLFHSVPTDENRRVIPEEAALLGRKASHGCIRLSVGDARWFYENIPAKASIIIHD